MNQVADARDLVTLGDPTRARILRLIRDSDDGRALVGRLAEALELRQPTVSHHMKALHDDGIVVREPDGRRVWYSIAPEHADRVDALLGDATAQRRGPGPGPDRRRSRRPIPRHVQPRDRAGDTSRRATSSSRADRPSPLLASRTAAFAATRLDALSRAAAHADGDPDVLFVCVQNAGRSQLAAGILRQLAGDRVLVRTAGSAPAGDVRHTIVDGARRDRRRRSAASSRSRSPTKPSAPPTSSSPWAAATRARSIPGRRYLDWDLEDPVGKPIERVRAIRDDIEARVRAAARRTRAREFRSRFLKSIDGGLCFL